MSLLFAQSINTQGVLRDANGYALDDGSYELTFRIYDAETGGTIKWTGIYTIAVANGVFNATLGDESNPVNMLDGSASYWMSIEVGSDGEMSPRLKLNTSAYEMAYLSGSENVFPGAGNVGIGTTSPDSRLSVWGDGSNNIFEAVDNASSTKMVITNAGAIGIGTTSPGKTLEIAGSEWPGIRINDSNSGKSGDINYWQGEWRIYNGNNETVTIKENGAVGIGTTSPSGTFHVSRTSLSAPSLTWGADATAIIRGERMEMAFGSSSVSPWPLYIQGRYDTNTAQNIVINPLGGDVGIGTTNPREKLEISGDLMLGYDGMLSMYSMASEYGSETIALQTTIDGRTVSDGLPYGTDNRYVLALQPEYGLVGIGTSTPTKPLTIDASHYNPIRINNASASNADANSILNDADDLTLLMGGVWGPYIYFYWKDENGNKYTATMQGSPFNGRSDMSEDGENSMQNQQLHQQEERIALLEAELAEIKALLKSN